jgi:hypothetical protein
MGYQTHHSSGAYPAYSDGIHVIRADGSRKREVHTDGADNLAYSPDGHRLAFSDFGTYLDECRVLYVISRRGSNPQRVAGRCDHGDRSGAAYPSWQPLPDE